MAGWIGLLALTAPMAGTPIAMTVPLHQLASATKSFGAMRALLGVSFDLRAGAPGQPGGLPEISRGLSAATPPVAARNKIPHPGGVPESFGVSRAPIYWRISGTPPGCI